MHDGGEQRGAKVPALADHRGDEILTSDEDVGSLRPGDWLAFAPLITEANGSERMSWVTSDGTPGEFGAIEGWYEGSAETWIVVSKTSRENAS